MRRRTFLAGLGTAAAAGPFAARADARIPRIGYLSQLPADAVKLMFEALKAGLIELGYVPGKTVEIELRFADGSEEREVKLARELVDLKVDVIVTGGMGVIAAHKATNTIPIVATSTPDPVALGLADSLAHPGGNVTGGTFFTFELDVKRIALLKQVKPAMTRVGLIDPPGDPFQAARLRTADAPLKALGVELEPIEVMDPSDCERALSAARTASIGGLTVVDAPQFIVGPGAAAIAAAAARHGLPGAGGVSLAANGGLLGYGVDFVSMSRRAATFVDKILKGARPGDIPIEQATKFITVINLKTAKALGLDIPPTLLAAADEVIE